MRQALGDRDRHSAPAVERGLRTLFTSSGQAYGLSVEMDDSLERWILEADEAERIDALIEFEGSVEVGDVAHILEVRGVIIAGVTDTGDALVSFTPDGLRGIMNQDWVASVVEPPPGTGDPRHPGIDLED